MMKRELIALLAVLLVITACGSQGTTPVVNTNNTGNANPTNTNNPTTVESNLEYCKMIIKTAQSQVNTFDRQEKTIKTNIDATKKKINTLKAVAGNEEAIVEEEADLAGLNDRLKETQSSLADAKNTLTDATTKCAKIAKKGDKTICKEFNEDLQQQIQNAQAALAKEEANLANIQRQYDTAKSAGKTTAFLASIDEEMEKKNLDILKIKNNTDKLNQMATQLNERCN
ncbi:MAG: hypothetical protein Q8L34_02980 [Candidatus Woesearchaeota archaeon]|nr:hypothetical protein [Candidatus Woesearchaeota archaeon]